MLYHFLLIWYVIYCLVWSYFIISFYCEHCLYIFVHFNVGPGVGQGHVIGAGDQEAVAVTTGEAGAVIVEVAAEVTGAGLAAGHDQEAGHG